MTKTKKIYWSEESFTGPKSWAGGLVFIVTIGLATVLKPNKRLSLEIHFLYAIIKFAMHII